MFLVPHQKLKKHKFLYFLRIKNEQIFYRGQNQNRSLYYDKNIFNLIINISFFLLLINHKLLLIDNTYQLNDFNQISIKLIFFQKINKLGTL